MSKVYDNWERLVKATLLREELRRLSREDSISSSVSSDFTWSFRESDSPSPGISFSYEEIALATDFFRNGNLIKRGHSGDLFTGYFPQLSRKLVVKRIRFEDVVNRKANVSLELEFFSRISSGSRFVPLVGHCLETLNEKFLVYGYMEKMDLSRTDSLASPNWVIWRTRLRIATGVAEALTYLHHECNPPLAHGDVQASSVLLDHNFEARLGSLSRISAQANNSAGQAKQALSTGKSTDDNSGNLGISSSSTDATAKAWLESTLAHISLRDKTLVTNNIVDHSLIIDEDVQDEVWAVAIVAKACLNPNPTKRPLMGQILTALKNPLKMVRGNYLDTKLKASNSAPETRDLNQTVLY